MQGAGSKARSPKTATAKPSDHDLLELVRKGDQGAATELYVRYAHRLRALAHANFSSDLARRIEADDIVQSVFRSFFRKVERGYYDVPEGAELWKLLLVIALNKIRDQGAFHRAAKRDVRLELRGASFGGLAKQRKADESACRFLQMVIGEVMEAMPEPYRPMVRLRIDGHEVAEIAHLTGRPKRSVERVLQQFRKKLRLTLEEDQ